jgi:TolA-binding protein
MKTVTNLAVAVLLAATASMSFAQPAPAAEARMGKMQETMQQIRQTEDPEKRAALLEAHLNEMHAVMARMHGELGQLMHGLEDQKRESKRLHDHRKTKR